MTTESRKCQQNNAVDVLDAYAGGGGPPLLRKECSAYMPQDAGQSAFCRNAWTTVTEFALLV